MHPGNQCHLDVARAVGSGVEANVGRRLLASGVLLDGIKNENRRAEVRQKHESLIVELEGEVEEAEKAKRKQSAT